MRVASVIETTVTDADIRALIEEEERRSGLRPDGTVDAVEIERRRVQISFIGLVVVGAVLALGAIRVFNDDTRVLIGNDALAALVMSFLAGVFAVYAIDKDRHLKRLLFLGDALLAVERRTAVRLLERAAFSVDELALHGTLDLETCTNQFAQRLRAAVGAAEVRVVLGTADTYGMVARAADHSSGASLRAPRTVIEAAMSGGAAVTMRVDHTWSDAFAEFGTGVCAPIGSGPDAIGVALVASRAATTFTSDEIDWIAGFATRAAGAIRNARQFEAALMRAEYLGQRTVATMAEELNLVARAISGVAQRLADTATPESERMLLLDGLHRTGARIEAMTARAREHMAETG